MAAIRTSIIGLGYRGKRLLTLLSSIDDFNITGKVSVPNLEVKKSRYHLIMHELNHNTHHRGEISALLDQMGYSNDYSNLLTII